MGIPEAERIDIIAAISGDKHVTRNSRYGGITGVFSCIVAEIVPMRFNATFKTDFNGILVAGDQPALHCGAPVVRDFRLLSVTEKLAEDTKLVADGIARSGKAERRHTLQIAGSKTAETTVSETSIRFRFKNISRIPAHVFQSTGQSLGNPEVECIFHEASAEKELHGHIMDFFLMITGVLYGKEAAHQLPNDNGGSLKDLVVGGSFTGYAENGTQLVFNNGTNFITGNIAVQCLFYSFNQLRFFFPRQKKSRGKKRGSG